MRELKPRSNFMRILLFLFFVILGTFLGIYLATIPSLSDVFRTIVSWGFNLSSVDLLAFEFGLHLNIRMNICTFIGAIVGFFVVR